MNDFPDFPSLRGHKAFADVRKLVRDAKEIYMQADAGYTHAIAVEWVKVRRADATSIIRIAQDGNNNAPQIASWDDAKKILFLSPSNIDGQCTSAEDLEESGAAAFL